VIIPARTLCGNYFFTTVVVVVLVAVDFTTAGGGVTAAGFAGGGVTMTDVFSSMISSCVMRGWFQKAASSPKTAMRKATSGIQSAARQPADRYQNPSKRTRRTSIAVATLSGVCAQVHDTGNSSQSKPPTTSAKRTSRMSHRRYALAGEAHSPLSGVCMRLAAVTVAVPVPMFWDVAGFELTGLTGTGFTEGAGVEVYVLTTGPEPSEVAMTEAQTG